MSYTPLYKPSFGKSIKKYQSMKKQIENKILAILKDPYYNTEQLTDKRGHDLRGLRSKRIDRNFRVIFGICEECLKLQLDDKNINICVDCSDDLDEKTVIFLAIGPHEDAYDLG